MWLRMEEDLSRRKMGILVEPTDGYSLYRKHLGAEQCESAVCGSKIHQKTSHRNG